MGARCPGETDKGGDGVRGIKIVACFLPSVGMFLLPERACPVS